MDTQGYISPEEVRQALRQIYRSDAETNLQSSLLESFSDELKPINEKGHWNPVHCSFSRWSCCVLCLGSLCISRWEGADEPVLRSAWIASKGAG